MVLSGIWKKHESSKEPPLDLHVSHAKDISPDEVQEICMSVGWSRRDPVLIARALANSLSVVSV
jgi:hypothetical protein